MVGLKKGETKEFSLVMPKEFKTFAGQTLKFKVEVFDVREEPPKPVAAAPTPPPATD